jgi:predicted DCC family thiol-disulfide oxidoreductase YuxK
MVTAIYDGHCVICQTTRRIVRALDWLHRVEFLDLHNMAEVVKRYPDLEHDEMMGEIHVVSDSGRVYPGFDGTRRMLRELPLGFPLWLLLNLPGMRWVGVRVYRWIAKNRYAVNRFFGVELPEADCEDGFCKLPE